MIKKDFKNYLLKDYGIIIGYLLISLFLLTIERFFHDRVFLGILIILIACFVYINFLKCISNNIRINEIKYGLMDLFRKNNKYAHFVVLILFFGAIQMLLVVPFLFFEIVDRPNVIDVLSTELSISHSILIIVSFFWTIFIQMVFLLSITRMAFYESDTMTSFLNAIKDAKNHLFLLLVLVGYNVLSDLFDLNAQNFFVHVLSILVFLIILSLMSVITIFKYDEIYQNNATQE